MRIKARDRRNTPRISRERNAEPCVEGVSNYVRDYGARGLEAEDRKLVEQGGLGVEQLDVLLLAAMLECGLAGFEFIVS